MKTSYKINIKPLIILLIIIKSIGFASSNQNASQDTSLVIWATTGPLAYLSGANIIVKNSRNQTIGRGITNERGILLLKNLNPSKVIFPLSISSTGGKALGKNFKGALSAEASSIGISSGVVFLDLISTSAKRISGKYLPYDKAIQSVRKALGIGELAPEGVIRVQNPFVRLDRLEVVEKKSGGFNAVVNQISRAAKSGKTYSRLQKVKTTTHALPGTDLNNRRSPLMMLNNKASTTTSSCSAESVSEPPPNGGQPNVIDAYAPILMEELGNYVGVNPAISTTIIPGMIWGSEDSENQDILNAIANVQKQLDCIDAKIDYVILQLEALQVQLSMADADACYSTAIKSNWSNYLAYTNSLGTSSPWDKNSSEILFSGFGDVIEKCGAAIDAGLFQIPSGASSSTWQTTFLNSQNKYGGFLFPVDNQGLQLILSDWNYKTYQYFVLSSEYYNYMKAYDLAKASGGYNSEDSQFCSDDTRSQSSNFCIWENNIKKAMPATIYSDEVAIISSGIAVNSVPGIGFPGTSCSGYYIGGVCYGYPIEMRLLTAMEIASYPEYQAWGAYFSPSHLSSLNAKPLNVSEVDTAIETYESPRVYRDRYIYNSDIAELLNYQDDITSFYFDAITNQAYIPNSVWKGLTKSQVSFGTYDSTAKISAEYKGSYSNVVVNPNAAINNFKSQSWCMIGTAEGYLPCDQGYPPHPTLGILLGRPWWTGSAKASQYLPPDPRCYMKSVPSGVTCF